jgi:hypothetical protein
MKTEMFAQTMALDPKTHRIYLSSADPGGPAPAGGEPKAALRWSRTASISW